MISIGPPSTGAGSLMRCQASYRIHSAMMKTVMPLV
jgi:hypothetical protein